LGFRKWREDDLVFAKKLWGDYEVTKFFDARDKLSQNEIHHWPYKPETEAPVA
jgi:hypothetical protein